MPLRSKFTFYTLWAGWGLTLKRLLSSCVRRLRLSGRCLLPEVFPALGSLFRVASLCGCGGYSSSESRCSECSVSIRILNAALLLLRGSSTWSCIPPRVEDANSSHYCAPFLSCRAGATSSINSSAWCLSRASAWPCAHRGSLWAPRVISAALGLNA